MAKQQFNFEKCADAYRRAVESGEFKEAMRLRKEWEEVTGQDNLAEIAFEKPTD